MRLSGMSGAFIPIPLDMLTGKYLQVKLVVATLQDNPNVKVITNGREVEHIRLKYKRLTRYKLLTTLFIDKRLVNKKTMIRINRFNKSIEMFNSEEGFIRLLRIPVTH